MQLRLTTHARRRCAERGVNENLVLEACQRHASEIFAARGRYHQVVVVLERHAWRTAPDGSGGDLTVAPVDPVRMTVCTVMYQGSQQKRLGSQSLLYIWDCDQNN